MSRLPALVLLAACGATPDGTGVADTTSPTAPVTSAPTDPTPDDPAPGWDPVEVLFRASLDLRGVRPTVDEIAEVEADPAAVDALIDAFLDDPRFEEQVIDHFASVYLTRRDAWDVTALAYGLYDEPAFASAVGQEPLRILARIAAEDLPYTELVTGDWTMADDTLEQIWPLDVEPGQGWRVARYTDGRPTAGVLTTNGLWWRYMSDQNNANRGRANAISKLVLCSDYLTRPITFDRDVDLLDADAVNNALQTNPGCIACHATLDPLASHLWGFYYFYYNMASDITTYHPDREGMWEETSGVAPAYYGTPSDDLEDLGYNLASDPRFVECAVQRVTERMLQRDTTLDDTAALTAAREVFLNDGLRLKALYRHVLASDEYRTTAKLPTPGLLASELEALTGYRMTYLGYDMLSTDTYGLRVLAGGVDGLFVTRLADAPTATSALVLQRVAEAAAWHVVEHDRKEPDAARLFTRVGFTETADTAPDVVIAQIQDLHLALFGHRVAADGPEVDANLELWRDLYDADGDPGAAWAGLLSVLLRDPDFLVY